MATRGAIEVVIAAAADDARTTAFARVVAERYVPSMVLVGGRGGDTDDVVLLRGRERDEATAYLCYRNTCEAPALAPETLAAQLDGLGSARG